jgi:hypothetical protein
LWSDWRDRSKRRDYGWFRQTEEKIIVNNKNPRRSGECCVRYADETVSDDALHEQLVAGVDVYDYDMQAKAELIKNGVPKEVMDRLIPKQ